MANKSFLISVLFLDRVTPVSGVSIQSREQDAISQVVNTLVDPGHEVGIPYRDDIEPAVVNTKAPRPVGF